ncbi:MAG: alpha-amylase [Gemmatimonadaceae bacterium]
MRLASRLRPSAALAALVTVVSAFACTEGSTLPKPVIEPPAPRPTLAREYRASGLAAQGLTAVHLFDWRWDDIALECETVLGPAGFAAVQVSPPNEHSRTPNQDWSQRYQPVSYELTRSRSGTAAQFKDMVDRCAAAGVGIYVDAVINHMTNFPSPGQGSAGTAYTKYEYPGLYTREDFHTPCALNDYSSAAQVQDCELYSLPDLRTASPKVRRTLSNYLIALARLGVAGFRVDAAKHIQQVDLDAIFDTLNATMTAEGRPIPYVFLEISAGSGEALQEADFYGVGYSTGGAADITEFTFRGVGDKFKPLLGQSIAQLNPNGPAGAQFSASAWGMMPSDKAVVFLQNHDTQRECGLGYQDGVAFRLANVWMLAQPYGYPSVLSGFAFSCPSQRTLGPPMDAEGWTTRVKCASRFETAVTGDWVCEHRDPHIRQMVGFRRRVAGTDVVNWWDNGAQAIAFSRGDKGFVAINREATAISASIPTPLAPGTYCDLITGGKAATGCAGTSVVVGADGKVALSLAATTAIAIDISTRR